jgi:mono/diheme cytochrome c family protein
MKILNAAFAIVCLTGSAAANDAHKIDFAKDVAPIFKASCVKCHGLDPKHPMKKGAGGLRLDDKTLALKGGKSGAALVAGKSADSLLFKLLKGSVVVDEDGKDHEIPAMPKVKKGEKWKSLPAAQVATIQQWIDQGANWR